MSVGIGYDIHKLSNEGIMTLGGIEIKNMPAFKAESDGDVIMHSIIDALLGASNKILYVKPSFLKKYVFSPCQDKRSV